MDEDNITLTGDSDLDFSFSPDDADVFSIDLPELTEQDGVTYPAVLLTNVLFMDALKVLKLQKKNSYREMEVWITLADNTFQHIGSMQIDSDTLIILKHLRIGITLYYDAENSETLDLSDPATLERFV